MRTVNINNKFIQFQSGVPLPTSIANGRGRPKGELRMILEAMRPGESVLLPKGPDTVAKSSGLFWELGRRMGVRFAHCAEGSKTRIFCVEREGSSTIRVQTEPHRPRRVA